MLLKFFRLIGIWPCVSNFFGDEIDRITQINTVTGEIMNDLSEITIYPATHFVTPEEKIKRALKSIRQELAERLKTLRAENNWWKLSV